MMDPFAKIKAREEARKAEKDRKVENRNEGELITRFETRIGNLKEEIQLLLKTAEQINLACEKLKEMRKELSEVVMVLPSHGIKQAQDLIDQLQLQIQNVLETSKPKKKFTFSAASKTPPSTTTTTTTTTTTPIPSIPHSPSITSREEWNCEGFIDKTNETLTRIKNNTNPTATTAATTTNQNSSSDFQLRRLKKCDIIIQEVFNTIHIAECEDCRVVLFPTRGSVYVDDCKNCLFFVSAQQLRIHSTSKTRFQVWCKSEPIIENCAALVFGPYCLLAKQPEQEADLKKQLRHDFIDCGFNSEQGNDVWNNVQDFNWIKQEHSPNWKSDSTIYHITFPLNSNSFSQIPKDY